MQLVAVLIFALIWSAPAQNFNNVYLRPANGSLTICPGQPCLTLNQLAENFERHVISSYMMLMLLPGDHVLQRELTLNMSTDSVVVLRGVSSTKIFLQNENATIITKNARNITIENITFMLHNHDVKYSALSINRSHVVITNCSFLGPREINENSPQKTVSIYSYSSNITVFSCLFQRNQPKTIKCHERGNLTISGCRFIQNGPGNVIESYSRMNIIITESVFEQNNGRALHCRK